MKVIGKEGRFHFPVEGFLGGLVSGGMIFIESEVKTSIQITSVIVPAMPVRAMHCGLLQSVMESLFMTPFNGGGTYKV